MREQVITRPPVSILVEISQPLPTIDNDPPCFEIKARTILRDGTRSDYRWGHELRPDTICSYSWEWEDPASAEYESLQLNAYSSSLAAALCYRDIYSLELERADRMARTLKRITRRRKQLLKDQAAPATFGQETALLAQIVKADVIGYEAKDMSGRECSLDGMRYRWHESRSEASDAVDRLIQRVSERYGAPLGFEAYDAAKRSA